MLQRTVINYQTDLETERFVEEQITKNTEIQNEPKREHNERVREGQEDSFAKDSTGFYLLQKG